MCDRAREILIAEQLEHPFEFAEVDVQDDEDLERAYGIRIPVVEIDGQDRFEYEVDSDELAQIVRGA